jgi:hypothetical protein
MFHQPVAARFSLQIKDKAPQLHLIAHATPRGKRSYARQRAY